MGEWEVEGGEAMKITSLPMWDDFGEEVIITRLRTDQHDNNVPRKMVKNTPVCQLVDCKYQLWNDPIPHYEYFKQRDDRKNGSEYSLLSTEENNICINVLVI